MKKKEISFYFVFVLMIFIFSGCQKPMLDSGERKFKKLSAYQLNDFHLNESVHYFEISKHGRTAIIEARYGTKEDPVRFSKIDTPKNKKTTTYSYQQLLKNLHSVGYGMMFPNFFTIRYVNENRETFSISRISELKSFLGEIDTPAELQMWFYLTGKEKGYSYKQSNNYYKVRWYYPRINDTGMCTHYSYSRLLNKEGKVIKTLDYKEPKICSESQKKGI